jgi:hypothetical protein
VSDEEVTDLLKKASRELEKEGIRCRPNLDGEAYKNGQLHTPVASALSV